MMLFGKKKLQNVIVNETQKNQLVEKLEDAHINYTLDVNEKLDYRKDTTYVIRLYASDLKKVV